MTPVVKSTPAVVRTALAWTLAPERAALLVRDDERPFALIGRWAGGGALIGSEPVRVASPADDPFALLDEQPATGDGSGAVGGGWFGWLGYGLCRRVEPTCSASPRAPRGPPFRLAYYDHVLRLDDNGRWWFEALWSTARDEALRARLRVLRARAENPPHPRPFATEPWRATPASAGHALAVGACRDRIHAGDLFQANICTRLDSRLEGSPLDLFAAAAARLRPDRAAFISDPPGAIASLSPELFLERHGRRVRSAPIKGTRPRPADPGAEAAQRQALLTSAKDRAENVMIVDLVRNDLGRVCVPGSIRVDALAEVRAHTGVWHLVSEVSGLVRDGVRDGTLLRAAFPPGSVSGAPKVAALDVIAELESTARELYTGAVGFASPVAGLELSVAIRTFEFRGRNAWLGVGGGIVADSAPLAEAEECMVKAAPLLASIGASLEREPPARAPARAAPPPRLGPKPLPRPDPAAGVFETVLVVDGRPVALDRHLNRLASSVRTLYDATLARRVGTDLRAAARPVDRGRLRLSVWPDADGVRSAIQVTPLPARRGAERLWPMTVPGGLGGHKWADRRLLAGLAAAVSGQPLLCDLDGLVLEAARANVFVVEDGSRVATPPADGRILPGVTRAHVFELGAELGLEVVEEPIDLGRLARAPEVFLTGALGGVAPTALEGRQHRPGPITAQLARAWRDWAGLRPHSARPYAAAARLPD